MPEVSESPPGERERIGWCAVPGVRQDCKAREAAQQERSRAHAGEPGSASSGVAVRSASRGPALAQTLSADTVEPGSASSSQAQVTPPASGRMAENASARAAGIAASDAQAREAAQQERSRAHAGEPGIASSGVAVRSASRGPTLISRP